MNKLFRNSKQVGFFLHHGHNKPSKIGLNPLQSSQQLSWGLRSLHHSTMTAQSSHQQNQPISLYNLSDPLHKPNDFITLTQQSISRINHIRAFLKQRIIEERSLQTTATNTGHQHTDPSNTSSQKLSPKSKLQLMDAISNELCCIMDAAELCRNSHANLNYQKAAEQSFALLSEFIIELNADHFLYEDVLLPIIRDENVWKSLTKEEQFFAIDLRRDFESEGIHLKDNMKELMKSLQQQVVNSETVWSQNLVNREELNKTIHIGPFPTVNAGSGQSDHFHTLSRWVQQFSISQPYQSQRYLTSNLDRRILQPLTNSISSEKLRKSLFLESLVQPSANIQGLHGLLNSRQSLAKVLQYPSYTHRALMKHVNGSPQYVHDLLRALGTAVRPQAIREITELREVQSRFEQEQQQSSGIFSTLTSFTNSTNTSEGFEPWNLGYYQNIAKQEKSLLQSSTTTSSSSQRDISNARQRISSYFPLNACVNGLQLVSQQLFGITMREVNIDNISENWGTTSKGGTDLRKFEIYNQSNHSSNPIGVCYFDLYNREHKFPGAAHFTIRCGCDRVYWDSTTNNTTNNTTNITTKSDGFFTERQTPIVALVFHFQHPHNRKGGFVNKVGKFFSQSSIDEKQQEPLLSLHDIETLFHEWGHALHSLLSTTKFQHLSGTRGGTDFIEIPSHLMEFFARDPQVIRQWARHYITNERIPDGLLESALDNKADFAAIELQHQVLLSGADQLIFGPEMKDIALNCNDKNELFIRVLDGIARVQSDLTVIPLGATKDLLEVSSDYDEITKTGELKEKICKQLNVVPSMNVLNHGHFVNYGGSYYSYLYAKMYAAQIWHQNFASDPLNPAAGELIRKEMLAYGCSRSPKEIFSAITKGDLDPNYYLKQLI